MKELIERLRKKAGQYDEYDWHSVTELESAAALERLTAENAALREGLDGWHARYLDAEVERDALRTAASRMADEMTALRADAERYRFIFAESGRVDPVCAVVWKKGNVRNSSEWVNSVGGEWLSKELDAAIGEKT